MDEQWGYVGAKSRQRWLFYAYDRIRRAVVAHVFGERTMATLERLLSLLSVFDVVVWMTDGWPMYESRLKGKLHVISKRYTQRIERHNLNLRQHLARLGRKSLSFSKSVELHDKVIGHYLNIKHYQQIGVITYSPWVNHVERLWQALHDTITRNHQCRSMWQLLKKVRYFMETASPFPGGKHGQAKV